MNTRDIRTLCMIAGPYRNLTTLTAAILSLHPNCQVLNHAGARILRSPILDFFVHPRRRIFEAFLKYATFVSTRGGRGPHGGSISNSHAFDDEHRLADLYRQRYRDSRLKARIRCLVWKESMRVTNHIQDNDVDLDALIASFPRIRFLLPVRHPLDCAVSNLNSLHASLFRTLRRDDPRTVGSVMDAILDEFRWFVVHQAAQPEHFSFFFAHSFARDTVVEMADFLDLPRDATWIDASLSAFQVKRHYEHGDELMGSYREAVMGRFSDFPQFRDGLLAYAERPA